MRDQGWRITLLAPAVSATALLGGSRGDVDEVWPWQGADIARLLAGSACAQTQARLRSFATAIAWSRSAELEAVLRRDVSRVITASPHPPAGQHAAAWFASALAPLIPHALLAAAAPDPPAAVLSDAARRLRAQLGGSFVALHPGSGSPAKNWPGFPVLARCLAPGMPLLVIQGPADEQAAGALRGVPGAIVGRDLPLRALGALLAHSACYVGNDSGVTHLAAAWGVPTVALFGPTDPQVWRPLGPHVCTVRAPGGDLSALAVGKVLAAMTEIQRARRGSPIPGSSPS